MGGWGIYKCSHLCSTVNGTCSRGASQLSRQWCRVKKCPHGKASVDSQQPHYQGIYSYKQVKFQTSYDLLINTDLVFLSVDDVFYI